MFWKIEFIKYLKCFVEKFEKDYVYGIRYVYGKEGKCVNYISYVCG